MKPVIVGSNTFPEHSSVVSAISEIADSLDLLSSELRYDFGGKQATIDSPSSGCPSPTRVSLSLADLETPHIRDQCCPPSSGSHTHCVAAVVDDLLYTDHEKASAVVDAAIERLRIGFSSPFCESTISDTSGSMLRTRTQGFYGIGR